MTSLGSGFLGVISGVGVGAGFGAGAGVGAATGFAAGGRLLPRRLVLVLDLDAGCGARLLSAEAGVGATGWSAT